MNWRRHCVTAVLATESPVTKAKQAAVEETECSIHRCLQQISISTANIKNARLVLIRQIHPKRRRCFGQGRFHGRPVSREVAPSISSTFLFRQPAIFSHYSVRRLWRRCFLRLGGLRASCRIFRPFVLIPRRLALESAASYETNTRPDNDNVCLVH